MANNYIAKDANGADVTFASVDNAGVHTPVHSILSTPLPTDAATATLQGTANTSLNAINGKLPTALGQTAMAAALSVTVASNQSAIPIADGGGSITVDGTIAATQSGTWAVTDGAGSLTVDGTVAATQSGTWNVNAITTLPALVAGSATVGSIASITTSVTPGTAAAQLGKAEDAAHADGDTGVMVLGVRQDTDASLASATGDYTPPTFSSIGRLKADVAGNVAHDAADAGNPIKVGAKARTSESVVSVTADRSDLFCDLAGKLIVLPYANPENFVSGAITTAMTGTTSTSLVAAPGAGLRNYITTIIVSNAHATVGTDIAIQDGSGGTTLLVIPAAAVYGGAAITLPTPLRQPTANTALYCANITTGASTKVSAVGYKGA